VVGTTLALRLAQIALGINLVDEPLIELVARSARTFLRIVAGMTDVSSHPGAQSPLGRSKGIGHEETNLFLGLFPCPSGVTFGKRLVASTTPQR
jgi:hypothetical protein